MPTDAEAEVLAALQRVFGENIPSGTDVAERAVAQSLEGHESDRPWIKERFSELVETVQVVPLTGIGVGGKVRPK